MIIPAPLIRSLVGKVMDGFVWTLGYNLGITLWEHLVMPLVRKFLKK